MSLSFRIQPPFGDRIFSRTFPQSLYLVVFLGGFPDLRRVSYFRHVCLSVRMEYLGSHRTDFDEIWYFRVFFFRKSVDAIQVQSKSDNNNGSLHDHLCTFMAVYCRVLVTIRNVSHVSCRENQNTHFVE